MSLKHLNDDELVASTKCALKTMREAEVDVLRHFREIEERKLWRESGSLYKYIARTFGLTADQIYPRLQAMRLMCAIPEVEQKLEMGVLSVTNALKAHQAFQAESKQRRVILQDKREVSLEEKREVLKCLENTSTKEADKILSVKYPESKKPPEKVKPVAKNQNLIQFYVDDETLRQIEELKAKFSHQMPSGKMEDLIKILIQKANRGVDQVVSSRAKEKTECIEPKQELNREPKPIKRVSIKTRSRYIRAEVSREMEKTRHLGCTHVDVNTGERCSSKHFLQMDHIHEYSQGGLNELQNLRWLCGFHNRHRFETSRRVPQDIRPEDYEGISW